jgi:Uma2 family endonuclease
MKSTVQVNLSPLTLQDFLKQPETKPASEYIDNQIIQKPRQQGKIAPCRENLSRRLMGY